MSILAVKLPFVWLYKTTLCKIADRKSPVCQTCGKKRHRGELVEGVYMCNKCEFKWLHIKWAEEFAKNPSIELAD
jgi:ribosomal protein L37AE/L43A